MDTHSRHACSVHIHPPPPNKNHTHTHTRSSPLYLSNLLICSVLFMAAGAPKMLIKAKCHSQLLHTSSSILNSIPPFIPVLVLFSSYSFAYTHWLAVLPPHILCSLSCCFHSFAALGILPLLINSSSSKHVHVSTVVIQPFSAKQLLGSFMA